MTRSWRAKREQSSFLWTPAPTLPRGTLWMINGNCRVIPVEVFETRYPWFTEEFALVPDSGGAGAHRGGLATTKTLTLRFATAFSA